MLGVGMCMTCQRLRPGTFSVDASCAAFPNGIPAEIIDGGFDHTQEYAGDNGVRYLPVDGTDVAAVLASCDEWRNRSTPRTR